MAGRPCKLNDEMKDSIVKCIISGLSYKYTCYYVGIQEKTFIEWRKQGEKDLEDGKETLFSQLLQEVKSAESKAILMRLENINDASKESWQAAAWFLERKYPDEFGKKERHDIGGELKVETFLSQLPPEIASEVIRLSLIDSDQGTDKESSS